MRIDDSQFYVAEDFSENIERFMEIELFEDYNIALFDINNLKKYGFIAPQGPTRITPQLSEYLSLVQNLINSKELEPDLYDGTYQLMRETIRAYKNMKVLSSCDFKDLNLVYQMAIGTWKQGIDKKQKTIEESNLSTEEKGRLKNLLQKIWQNAENFKYNSQEKRIVGFGMFGTGFYSFERVTDNESTYKFIQMCIDISDMDNDEKIFSICEKILDKNFKGMRSASASMVLHCLKPYTFPILNSNQGSKSIFKYFNVPIKKIIDLDNYINNCRKIKKFRDENFSIKNQCSQLKENCQKIKVIIST